jgi:hypothetical protein
MTVRTRPAHDTGYDMVHVLRKRITYLDRGTEVTVGTLPAGAIVIGGGVHIITAFNGSGTDLLDVGFAGGSSTDDPNAYATILTLAAVGFIALDELAATTNIQQTKDCRVTATYTDENSNATAGVADVVITYVRTVVS